MNLQGLRSNPCLDFIFRKPQWGKHEISHTLALIIVSLKTLYEKNLMVKTHKRKEYNVKRLTSSIIQRVPLKLASL
jgi:hypothetical protein